MDNRKNVFAEKVVRPWNRLPRVESASLEVSKKMSLCVLLSVGNTEPGAGHGLVTTLRGFLRRD